MMTKPRRARIERKTNESEVVVDVIIDGQGRAAIDTGVGMFDHLLGSLARHGLFDFSIKATGDYHVDQHHTVEDISICLGRAFNEALGDRRGIRRMAHAYVPLDEALAFVAVDIGGRPWWELDFPFTADRIGTLNSQLVAHVLQSFVMESRMNLHARIIRGADDHHKAEALFKALARALDDATQIDPRRAQDIPSTKGVIEA